MCKHGENKIVALYIIATLTTTVVGSANMSDGIKYVEAYSKLPPVDYNLADCQKSDVQYRLFTKEDDDKGKLVDEESVSLTENERNLPTKLFIHGWTTNETSYWYGPLKDEYLKKGPHNIIYIDWSAAGSKPFQISAANVDPIGSFIADFLIASRVALEKVHVIGHSLGSHVAGFIGKHVAKKTGGKIGRITGTDPAGPTFEHSSMGEDLRLSEGDAEFVDVVHSDAGHYGFIAPIGHVDYYPNGGRLQPGCPDFEEDDNCSHARSNLLFIESVNSTKIEAVKCSSWKEFETEDCDKNETVVFGESVNQRARGKFYFKTKASPPFV